MQHSDNNIPGRAEFLKLEARGGPKSIREVVLVLVMPVVELANDPRWRGYNRFTSDLQASDRETLRAALRRLRCRDGAPLTRC